MNLAEIAPSGTLKIGINTGNTMLVRVDPAGGEPGGVAVELGRALARRLGLPLELIAFDGPGRLADAVKSQTVDLAFLAVDPARAGYIAFSAPYVELEGLYLVRADSPLRHADEADRPGTRIAAAAGAAYTLHLTRALRHAKLVLAETPSATEAMFQAGDIEVLAGIRKSIVMACERMPGTRILEGRFMVIGQAAGVPQGRPAALAAVHDFIEEAKASGQVAALLERFAVDGASLAPLAPR